MTVVRRYVLIGAAIVVAAQAALAQASTAAREKAAADAVAKFIEQTRERKGLPRLQRINDKHLRADACRRLGGGDKSLGSSDGIGPPEKVGTLSAFWYSTLDPTQPPPELAEWALNPTEPPLPEWAKVPDVKYEQPRRFAVGVCLNSRSDSTEQRYWIDVGTYMSAIKSILNIPTWD
ncbi:MAG TPA: hypothetical protein VGS78_10255 [Candidatus Sulfotelmatobacter sp.]|nr:hypothetical protein [Candidatus Sulfotelmatobacter sp.]